MTQQEDDFFFKYPKMFIKFVMNQHGTYSITTQYLVLDPGLQAVI